MVRYNKVVGLIIIFSLVFSTVVFALTADEYYQRGIGKYLTGDFDGALQELKEALKIDPNHKKAKELLPTALKSKSEAEARREKAASKAREVAREREEEITRHQELGRAYYRKGELYKAIEEFKHVLTLDPQDTMAKEYIQKTEEKIKEIEKAETQAVENERRIVQYYALGEEHYRGGRYLEALNEWDRVLALVPKHTGVDGYLAGMRRSYLAGKLTPKVAKRFIQVIAQRRSDKEAKGLVQERTRIEAQMKARKAQEVKEAKIREYALKGKTLYGEDKYQEAIIEFKKILALEPEHSEAINYITRAQETIKGREEAQREVVRRKVSEEKAREIAAHYGLGKTYYKAEQYRDAMEEFKKILTIDPEHKGAVKYIERAQEALKRSEEERVLTEKTAKEKERERKITRHYNSGVEYYKEDDLIEASEEFKKILALDPKHTGAKKYLAKIQDKLKAAIKETGAYYTRGIAYYERGEYSQAIGQWEKVLALDPTNERASSYIRRAQEKLKEIAEAEKALERRGEARKRERKIAEYYKRGYNLYRAGDLERAAKEFRALLRLNPNHREAQEYLTKVRSQLAYKEKPIVVEEPKSKPEVDPAEIIRHYNKGLVEYANGRLTEAVKEWEKVLELDPDHEKARKNIREVKKELEKLKRR